MYVSTSNQPIYFVQTVNSLNFMQCTSDLSNLFSDLAHFFINNICGHYAIYNQPAKIRSQLWLESILHQQTIKPQEQIPGHKLQWYTWKSLIWLRA